MNFVVVLLCLLDITQFLVTVPLVVFSVVVFFVVARGFVFVFAFNLLLAVVVVGGRYGSFFKLGLLVAVVVLVLQLL